MAANLFHGTQASPLYDVLILDVHMPKVSINNTIRHCVRAAAEVLHLYVLGSTLALLLLLLLTRAALLVAALRRASSSS
jgi:hypothetical protein